jgi:endonuclease YncB( thermonuclease family)
MDGRRQGILASFCWVSWMAAIVVLPTEPAGAESRPSTSCRSEPGGTGKVRAITDGRSFTLDDGREIRLAGIEAPLLPGPGEAGTRAKAGLAARATLESIIAGQNVDLRQNDMPADRYGRTTAFVYVSGGALPESVAHEMLARGFARVSAHVGERPCADELLARERAARQAKLGLWGEPYYVIVSAESGAELVAESGHFILAEGKVWSVRESGGTIYVNFGRQWSQALTVTILKRNERMFAAAGLEPKKLENRSVRVRGWVEERNGPRIEVTRPEQIEIAGRN